MRAGAEGSGARPVLERKGEREKKPMGLKKTQYSQDSPVKQREYFGKLTFCGGM